MARFVLVSVCVWRAGGGVEAQERSKRRCGGRFVEMVIICRIDSPVARAAGTHRLARTHAHRHK